MHVPWLWWRTGSRSRSMNIPSSSGWQPAKKRSTMEERDAVAALPWNLLPTLVRIRPYKILHNDNPQTPLTTDDLTEYWTKKWDISYAPHENGDKLGPVDIQHHFSLLRDVEVNNLIFEMLVV